MTKIRVKDADPLQLQNLKSFIIDLGSDYQYLNDLLFRPSSRFINTLYMLPNIDQKIKESWMKLQLNELEITQQIYRQFNSLEEWNYDEDPLCLVLKELTKIFKVNPLRMLVQYFTVRLKNGLIYYDLLEFTISKTPTDTSTQKIIKMVLNKQYNAFSAEPDEKKLSSIRINFLSEQKRLEFEIRTIILMKKFNILKGYESPQPRVIDYSKFFDCMASSEYHWLFYYLIQLDHPKSAEYVQQIQQSSVKNIDGSIRIGIKEEEIGKLIDERALSIVLTMNTKKNKFYFENNYMNTQNGLYLKYNLSNYQSMKNEAHFMKYFPKINILVEDDLKQLKSQSKQVQNQIIQSLKQAVQTQFKRYLSFFQSIIDSINAQKPIFYFKSEEKYERFGHMELANIIQLTLQLISETFVQVQKIPSIANTLCEIHTQEIMIRISSTFNFLAKSQEIKQFKFLSYPIFRLLMKLAKNKQNLNSKDFLTSLPSFLDKCLKNEENNEDNNMFLRRFLDQNWKIMISYGFEPTKFVENHIYASKLNELLNEIYQKAHYNSRAGFQNLVNNQTVHPDKQRLAEIIDKCPNFIPFFKNQIKSKFTSLESVLKEVNIFKITQKQEKAILGVLIYLLEDNIDFDQTLKNFTKEIIKKYSQVFSKILIEYDWKKLAQKMGLDLTKETIQHTKLLLELTKNTNLHEIVKPEDLCQRVTSQNHILSNLINCISYLQILIRQKKGIFISNEVMRNWLEITLQFQRIQCECSDKIIQYQLQYTDQKLNEMINQHKKWKTYNETLLISKIHKYFSDFNQICWLEIVKYGKEHINQAIIEFKFYFERLNKQDSLLLKGRILQKCSNNFKILSRLSNISLIPQLYNYNKQEIFFILEGISKIGVNQSNENHSESSLLPLKQRGQALLITIKQRRNKKLQISSQYIFALKKTYIQKEYQNILKIFFEWENAYPIIFNKLVYTGRKNEEIIWNSFACDVIERATSNLNKDNSMFYSKVILNLFQNKHLSAPTTSNTQQPFECQSIIELKLVADESQITHLLIKLTKILFEMRSTVQNKETTVQFYYHTLSNIKPKQIGQKIVYEHAQAIVQYFSDLSTKQKLQSDQLSFSSMWLNSFLDYIDVKRFSSTNPQFIRNYLSTILRMINKNQVEIKTRKDGLLYQLSILEKYIPNLFPQSDNNDFSSFAHLVFQTIASIISIATLTDKSIIKLKSILVKMAKNNRQQFYPYFDKILSKVMESNINWEQIFNMLLRSEDMQQAEMEADMKSYFLRQSQNLVEQSQIKILALLTNFIDQFKNKYSQKISEFSHLVSKFVKKTVTEIVKKNKTKKLTYLIWDKRQQFQYCQNMKKDFAAYRPSQIVNQFITKIFVRKNNLLASAQTLTLFKREIHYHPLIIPSIIFHPIKNGQNQMPYLQYLLQEVYTSKDMKQKQALYNFLFAFCLDHACIIKKRNKPIFISQYICYRIIKKIMEKEINENMLLLILNMIQLKRFASLCRFKLNQHVVSIRRVLMSKLKKDRDGLYFEKGTNLAIYKILQVINRQQEIQNLKQTYIVKKSKFELKNYKLINDCFIPFSIYEMPRMHRKEKRQRFISFTGSNITSFIWQQDQKIELETEYKGIQDLFYCQSEDRFNKKYLFTPQIDINSIKSFNFIEKQKQQKTKDFEKAQIKGTFTNLNRQFYSFWKNIRFMFQQHDKQSLEYRRFKNQIQRAGRGRFGQQSDMMNDHGTTVREQRRRIRGRRQNRFRGNRYAPEDFNAIMDQNEENVRSVEDEFKEELKKVTQEISTINQIQQITQNKGIISQVNNENQELEEIICKINNNLEALEENPKTVSLNDYPNLPFYQKKQQLQLKLLQTQFDLNFILMDSEQFKSFCQGNAMRLQKLDDNRKNKVLRAEEQLFSINLQRTQSSDSYIYIQDTLDQNYQKLANIQRKLSRQSSISSQSSDGSFEQQDEQFNNGSLVVQSIIPVEAFPYVNDDDIFEVLLSLYYNSKQAPHKTIVPLLQNKRIQSKVLNTLIYIMRSPLQNDFFPKDGFQFPLFDDKKWVKSDDGRIEHDIHEKNNIIGQILESILFVKSFCFYRNSQFLFEPIDYRGIYNIELTPCKSFQNYFKQNEHQPFAQILYFALEASNRKLASLIIKQTSQLPTNLLNKLFDIFKENDKDLQQKSQFRRRRIFLIYEFLQNLSKNKEFQNKYLQEYPFGQNDPNYYMIAHLLKSGIYTKQQLKHFHIKALKNSSQNQVDKLQYLNKVISIYSEDELKNQCNFLSDFKKEHLLVIERIRRRNDKIEQEPIYSLFKYRQYFDLSMKSQLFYSQLSNEYEEYNSYNDSQVIAKKAIGVFQSAFQDLKNSDPQFWQGHIFASFLDKNNNPQKGSGIGVTKQWFNVLTSQMVNLDYGLFIKSENDHYHLNPQSGLLNPRHLYYLQFIGKIFAAAAIHPHFFINPEFTLPFYKMILGEKVEISDLMEDFNEGKKLKYLQYLETCPNEEVFQQLYEDIKFQYKDVRLISSQKYNILKKSKDLKLQNSQQSQSKSSKQVELVSEYYTLKEHTQEENEKRTLTEGVALKVAEIVQLKPNGSNIVVTFQTRGEYIKLISEVIYDKLITKVSEQFKSFMEGFNQVCDIKLLKMFTPNELKQLIEGTTEYSQTLVEDLKKNVKILGYNPEDRIIKWLWQEIQSLNQEDRIHLMHHWTSLRKMPTNGVAGMEIYISSSDNKVFFGATCGNTLSLYNYPTREELRENIQLAIAQIKEKQSFLVG